MPPPRRDFARAERKEVEPMTCHLTLRRPLPFLTEIRAVEERWPIMASDICQACGRPIPPPRWEAQSTARLCMTCEDTAAHLGHS